VTSNLPVVVHVTNNLPVVCTEEVEWAVQLHQVSTEENEISHCNRPVLYVVAILDIPMKGMQLCVTSTHNSYFDTRLKTMSILLRFFLVLEFTILSSNNLNI